MLANQASNHQSHFGSGIGKRNAPEGMAALETNGLVRTKISARTLYMFMIRC